MSTKAKTPASKTAKKMSTKGAGKKKNAVSAAPAGRSGAKESIEKGILNTHGPGKDEKLPGYPLYPANEDIYARTKEETDIDPENLQKKKTVNTPADAWNEKDFNDDMTAEDLDIPGNEADEEEENAGLEDEENNYYSLGDELK